MLGKLSRQNEAYSSLNFTRGDGVALQEKYSLP